MDCHPIIMLIVVQYIVTVYVFVSSEIAEVVRSLTVNTVTDNMVQYDNGTGTEQKLSELKPTEKVTGNETNSNSKGKWIGKRGESLWRMEWIGKAIESGKRMLRRAFRMAS